MSYNEQRWFDLYEDLEVGKMVRGWQVIDSGVTVPHIPDRNIGVFIIMRLDKKKFTLLPCAPDGTPTGRKRIYDKNMSHLMGYVGGTWFEIWTPKN